MQYTVAVNSLWWFAGILQQCPRMALSASVSAGILIYYLIEVVKHPSFACRSKSRWGDFLSRHLSILGEKYWPTPWCFESRAQTVLASVLRTRLPNIKYKSEVLRMKDGGEVCLDWLEPFKERGEIDPSSKVPIVVILPGLTGHSHSEYVKSFVCAAHEVGANCVVFNNRGRGIPLKTARTYCAANSDDFEESLIHIKATFPNSTVIASGISLGGMILGNYLTTRGKKAANYLDAAMALSIPWNVFIGNESLEKPLWNLLLNRHLAHCLCESVWCMKDALEGNHPWDLDQVMKSKTIREFDARFTAIQFGYDDVDDYYRSACLHDKLDRVRVPLVCLSAADDPFQPIEGIPIALAKESSHVAIVMTQRGGHIGFMEGLWPTSANYSDRLFQQLVKGVFSNATEMQRVKQECKKYAAQNEL